MSHTRSPPVKAAAFRKDKLTASSSCPEPMLCHRYHCNAAWSIGARTGALAAQGGAASAAAANATAGGDSYTFAHGQVLVRFSQSAEKRRRLLATQPPAALAGLSLVQYVGRHHQKVPPLPGAGAAAVAAAVAASPPDATILFAITDGSTVQQKVAQLNALPGEGCRAGVAVDRRCHLRCAPPVRKRHWAAATSATAVDWRGAPLFRERHWAAACPMASPTSTHMCANPLPNAGPPLLAEVELAEPNFARRVERPGGAAATAAATSVSSQAAAGGSAFTFLPNDPDFLSSEGWHLRQVAAPLAWATSKGGHNVSRRLAPPLHVMCAAMMLAFGFLATVPQHDAPLRQQGGC